MIPKFRAWLPTLKWMCEVTVIDYDLRSVDICRIEDVARHTEMRVDKDEVVLMQSTGIKDKNGTEIFEGDIITTNSFACVVSFGKYDYFEDDGIKITGIGFYLGYLNVEPATYSPFETPFLENCEVLGNIYETELDLIMYEQWKSENPELMEGDE